MIVLNIYPASIFKYGKMTFRVTVTMTSQKLENAFHYFQRPTTKPLSLHQNETRNHPLPITQILRELQSVADRFDRVYTTTRETFIRITTTKMKSCRPFLLLSLLCLLSSSTVLASQQPQAQHSMDNDRELQSSNPRVIAEIFECDEFLRPIDHEETPKPLGAGVFAEAVTYLPHPELVEG